MTEWQTKTLVIALSGLAQSAEQSKAMTKFVKSIKLPLADEVNANVDKRSIEDIIENGAIVDLDSQPSYEQLTSMIPPARTG